MPNFGISSRGIIGSFYEALQAAEAATWASKIGMRFRSDQDSETYKWLGMSPAMREWVGGRQPKGLREAGMTIVNKTWESTLEISVDDLRRDKSGQLRLRIGELADRAARQWEILLSTLITNGNGTSSGLCYDGQSFFDSDHSEGDSGTQVNLITASQVTQLDVTTAAAPTETEMANAILHSIAYMMGYLDDRGQPMNDTAHEFLIMTPKTLYGQALAAISKMMLVGASGAVTDNILKNSGFQVGVIMNPRLTWTTDFAIFRTDGRAKPFILQEEEGVTVQAIAEGSEEEFKNNRHLYGVKRICNVGFGLWQHAARCTLS